MKRKIWFLHIVATHTERGYIIFKEYALCVKIWLNAKVGRFLPIVLNKIRILVLKSQLDQGHVNNAQSHIKKHTHPHTHKQTITTQRNISETSYGNKFHKVHKDNIS